MEKPLKVFWNGKRLKDIYPHATRFQVLKYKTKRVARKIFLLSAFFTILYTAFFLGSKLNPATIYTKAEVIREIDSLSTKIEQLKEEVLDLVKQGESQNKDEDYALITFDPHKTNNKVEIASVGSYQYKIPTVIFYYKKLYNQDITRKQAVLIALDDNKARSLTKDIIFKENGVRNWFNTKNKYNLEDKIAVINKLTK